MKKTELLNEIEVLKEKLLFEKSEFSKHLKQLKEKKNQEMYDDFESIKKLLEKYGVSNLKVEGMASSSCFESRSMKTIISFEINN